MGEFILDKIKIDEYFRINSKSGKKTFIIEECLKKSDSTGKPVSIRKCATALGLTHSTLNKILKDDTQDDFPSPLKQVTKTNNNNENLIGIETRLSGLEDQITSILTHTSEQETKIIKIDKSLEILTEKINLLVETSIKNVALKVTDSQVNNDTLKPNNIYKKFLKLQKENDDDGSIPMTFRILKSVHQNLHHFSDEYSLNKTSIITVLVDEYIKKYKEENEQNK